MLNHTYLLAALASLTLLPTATNISFAPTEGSVVTKTYTLDANFTLDNMAFTMGDLDLTAMMGEMPFGDFESSESVVLTDRYLEVGHGRPLALQRHFDSIQFTELARTFESDEKDEEDEPGNSEMFEGRTVLMTWDADAEAYDFELAEEADASWDDKYLKHLSQTTDMRLLLPLDSVKEDEQWQVSLMDIMGLISPVFALDTPSADDAESELMTTALEELTLLTRNEYLTCTYIGTVERDEKQLAQIDLLLDSELEFDLLELAIAAAQEDPNMAEATIQEAQVSADLGLKGSLFWDLDAGHLESMQWTTDLAFACNVSLQLQGPQPEMVMDMLFNLEAGLVLEQTALYEDKVK